MPASKYDTSGIHACDTSTQEGKPGFRSGFLS
jgi:hypothetical protein